MPNHDGPSVPSRERRGTQRNRPNLRRDPNYSALALANRGALDRALEATQKLIPSPRAVADMPGLPSESRLSHWRNSEDSPVYRVLCLVNAGLSVGQPVEDLHAPALAIWETIEIGLGGNGVPLMRALVSAQAYDAEQDIAAIEAAADMSDAALDRLIARLRPEIASKRTLLSAAVNERERRQAAA